MRRRWIIVGLLFCLSAVNYLDRQALSVLAPTLRQELGFGPSEYSYIVTAFLIAYAMGFTFCGRLVDRYGVKWVLAIALAFWSLAGMAHALAASWIGLLVCRFLLGLGESFNVPAATKVISEWVPRRERGLSSAIFSNGFVMGAVLAPPFVSFVSLRWGWQWGFLATGAVGFVMLAIWWRTYETPERHATITEEERSYILRERVTTTDGAVVSWRTLLKNPATVGFFGARFLTDSVAYFFSFWLLEYLQSARGLTLAMIGLVGWIPFIGADIGGPGGGAASDWLVRRGLAPRAARLRLMLLAACLTPLAFIAVRTETAAISIALIAVVFAASSCWNANLLTLTTESFPRSQIGSATALASLGGSLGGIISTLLTGYTVQSFGYVSVFTVLGGVHLAAFAWVVFHLRRASAESGGPDPKTGIAG